VPARRLDLLVAPGELAERRRRWKPRPPKATGGFLDLYRRIVSDSAKGAVLGVTYALSPGREGGV